MRTLSFARAHLAATIFLLPIQVLFPLLVDAQHVDGTTISLRVQNQELRLSQPDLGVTFEKVWAATGPLQIHRRADGMLWLVAASGVFRYDGYEVRYFHEPWDKPEARFASFLICSAEDENGTFWLGAHYGFERFDDLTGSFESFTSDSSLPTAISHSTILSICPDGKGNIWVGTRHGLNRFDRATRTFQHFYHIAGDPNSLLCDSTRHLAVGNDGRIWAGSSFGLSAYHPATETFTNYTTESPPPLRLPMNEIKCLYVARDGLLWIATAGGISAVDYARGKSRLYPFRPADPSGLRDSVITSLAEDGLGNLWAGTGSHGLVRLDPGSGRFVYYLEAEATRAISLMGNRGHFPVDQMKSVRHIFTDRYATTNQPGEPKVLWVIADGAVWRVAVAQQRFMNLMTKTRGTTEPRWAGWAVATGRRHLWTMTPTGAIAQIDLRTMRQRTFAATGLAGNKPILSSVAITGDGTPWLVLSGVLYRADLPRHLLEPVQVAERIGPILTGRDGSLWFATMRPEKSLPVLVRLEPGKGYERFDRDRLPGEGTVGLGAVSMLEDRNGEIWFGTFGRGLYRFDPRCRRYRHYTSAPGVKGTLKTSVVRALQMDSSGVIWIGTDSGLHRYIPETDSFERFTTTGRESDDQGHFIRGMAFDQKGDLWLAHSKGISRFDRGRARFRDFTEFDGLKRVQYFTVAFESLSRTMYALDVTGSIIAFRPEDLPGEVPAGKVILTEFRVFENPVSLPESISRTHSVTLTHDQNFFSFRFSALEFLRTDKIHYAYRMEGFDRDWVQAGARAYAGYTNLDHGSYLFHVRATNADGVWSDSITSLSVVITPPWWKTPWAYSLFTLLLLSALYGSWQYDRRRVQLRHQLEMKGFEARKLLEVDQLKTRFFANISHECRTPLTLILGPAGKLHSRLSDTDARRDLETIKRNANSLLGLINQLLDLSKVDAGRMVLQVCPMDLVPLLKRLVASFSSLADRKRVALIFDPHEHELVAFVDQEKLEKIVVNLLSNAFKFTGAGGEIVVTLRRRSETDQSVGVTGEGTSETGWVEISVIDTGVGIPEKNLEKVFDRFYQVDSSSTRAPGGTGIGLSLTKELVELHRGYIHVTSKTGVGSTFLVGLPLGKEKYAADQIIERPAGPGEDVSTPLPIPAEATSVEEDEVETTSGPPSAPIVLIVEDNAELRRYIRDYLVCEYRVAEAADGVEGLDCAFSNFPDLVITDIMMPRLDGVELCRQLKNDERTSHIPVILLTARASGESKVEAFEAGADDFIIKPFEVEELLIRVRNLIEIRRELREKFRENIVLQPADIAISSNEGKFLKSLMESIERHMAEPDCDTETLAKDVCMSRMQLNRKLHALTGHSTHELVRALRLNRASQLLQHHSGNVSEVAYQVGFASPSHFAHAFKERFGVSPSDYRERNRENSGGE